MKLIVHDLSQDAAEELFKGMTDTRIISDDGTIRPCMGCFRCWVKTPGQCTIRDAYGDMGQLLSRCDELLIFSRCTYGSYSPFIKSVLDRSISYIHPDFVKRNGEMHHRRRYPNRFLMKVTFYGEDVSEAERETANVLVKANALNFDCDYTVSFVKDETAAKEVLA